jgi:hypothetical protein
MTDLSPAALAVWEAFNQEEPGVLVDYGDCLAAALRAAADQVVPHEKAPNLMRGPDLERLAQRQHTRAELLAIADELGTSTTEIDA